MRANNRLQPTLLRYAAEPSRSKQMEGTMKKTSSASLIKKGGVLLVIFCLLFSGYATTSSSRVTKPIAGEWFMGTVMVPVFVGGIAYGLTQAFPAKGPNPEETDRNAILFTVGVFGTMSVGNLLFRSVVGEPSDEGFSALESYISRRNTKPSIVQSKLPISTHPADRGERWALDGLNFEKYIITRFSREANRLLDCRGDKSIPGYGGPESSGDPDVLFMTRNGKDRLCGSGRP